MKSWSFVLQLGNMQGRGSPEQCLKYKMFMLHQPGLNRTSMDTKGKPCAQWAAKWETSRLHAIGPFTQSVQGRTVVPLLRLAGLLQRHRSRMRGSKSLLLWARSRGINSDESTSVWKEWAGEAEQQDRAVTFCQYVMCATHSRET